MVILDWIGIKLNINLWFLLNKFRDFNIDVVV